MLPDRRNNHRDSACAVPPLPVFDHLAAPPGRWVVDHDRGTSHWEGIVSWLTQHGNSSVRYYMGEMISVWGLTAGDGSEVGYATLIAPYSRTSWQRMTEEGAQITGSLELTADGILFRDNPRSARRPGNGFADLLSVDAEFLNRLADKAFADTVCGYLAENTFRRIGDDARVRFPARAAEDLIMRLCGIVADRSNRDCAEMVAFEEILEDIGWHAMTPEEIEADRFKAIAIIANAEARVAGEVPEESRPTVLPLRPVEAEDGTALYRRALALGAAGMFTQIEMDRFSDLCHPGARQSNRLRPAG